MKPERWKQIDQLLDSALQQEASQRAAFLEKACAGDEELRREVESLLAHQEQAEDFIEVPALGAAAKGLAAGQPQSLVGQQIDAYKIRSLLGVGGMGEVYLAQDPRLDRAVALKILPTELASDPDRIRRFIREARAASGLKHPNVATIYEIGKSDEFHFIAMEYVEGQTLANKISGRPLPIAEIVDIGIQVADALDEAHRKRITHRDIKPANLMLTSREQVKILDFGLAKVTRPEGQATASDTSTAMSTVTGVVMGTVQYMSPEQVLGKEVDHRTDIFSLGVVLYEMATGRLPFTGNSMSETLDRVLHANPEAIARFNYDVPAELERIIRKCLEKDRERRYQSGRDLEIDLKNLKRDSDAAPVAGHGLKSPTSGASKDSRLLVSGSRWLSARSAVLAVLLTLIIGIAVWFSYYQFTNTPSKLPPMRVVRLTSFPGRETEPALSPDGKMVAFVWDGEKGDNADIYGMLVDSGRPVRLTTDPGQDFSPAWSPDGRFIAFQRQSKEESGIYLIPGPYREGPERRLADVKASHVPGYNRSLDWSPDGKFLAVSDAIFTKPGAGLLLLSVETGEKKQITLPSTDFLDLSAVFSPDGRTLAFTRATGDVSGADIYSVPVQGGGEAKRLTTDQGSWQMQVAWSADGREIIFAVNGRLHRIPSDGGKAAPLAEGGQFGSFPSISREGNRLVYSEQSYDSDIWRIDLPQPGGKGAGAARLISSSQQEDMPYFSPNGKKITFASNRSGRWEIWTCDSDGRHPLPLTSIGGPFATGTPRWASDGKLIAFDSRPYEASDIFVISPEGGSPRRLTTEPSNDFAPSWSRVGRWIYFCSDRGGQGNRQIWKMPAEGGPATQVTHNGGFEAFESFDRNFLFYSKWEPTDEIWKIPIAGGQESLFLKGVEHRYWAVAEGGMYFVATEGNESYVKFIDFATLRITQIMRLERKLSRDFLRGLALSPDAGSLLCTLIERESSDLVLVENFR